MQPAFFFFAALALFLYGEALALANALGRAHAVRRMGWDMALGYLVLAAHVAFFCFCLTQVIRFSHS